MTRSKGIDDDAPVIPEEEVEDIERLDSGELPHERIYRETDEKVAVPREPEDIYADPEFEDSDIATEKSKDLREKAAFKILDRRELRFVFEYYEREPKGIRNLAFDFQDALPENLELIGRMGLEAPRCYIWLAEEIRTYLKSFSVEFIITDKEVLQAAEKYLRNGNVEEARKIALRFVDVRTRTGRRMIKKRTVNRIEQMIEKATNKTSTPTPST